MINAYKQHIERLRFSGLRATKQRLIISMALFNKPKTFHFTIENLKKIIDKNTKNKISVATLYNTVHAFKKRGYLKEIFLKNNKTFFDTNIKNHYHFYDEDTEELFDINSNDVLINKVPTMPNGKKIKEIEITLKIASDNQNHKK